MLEKVNLIKSPLVENNLSIIRNKNTNSKDFREAISKLADILAINATQNLPLKEIEIETPITKTKTKVIDNDNEIYVVPILRAGLAISDNLCKFLPFFKVQHLGMCRNEKTLEPMWYYNKLPQTFKQPKNTYVYICDPMLATGGSLIEAIKLYINKDIPEENITSLNIIAAPEGINKVKSLYPNINMYITAIDEKLNDNGYIVPGLGDAGDRFFNTIY